MAGGERSGKSKTAAMYAVPRTLDADLGWIIAADYKQARAEFLYLLDAYVELGLLANHSLPANPFAPAVLFLTTGLKVETITGADESKIGMLAPDWVIAAEAAQLSFSMFLRIRGRLSEKRGWGLLEGTFENSADWYADLWEEWAGGTEAGEKSYSLATWSNTQIFPGGRNDPEILAMEKALSAIPGRFSERYDGVPVPSSLSVHPEFRATSHVVIRPFNPDQPVELAIDPGYNGAYCVNAIQVDHGDIFIIDEVYEQRVPAREIIRMCRSREWWDNVRPQAAGVIDIAGTQHPGNESQVEIWASPVYKGGAGVTLRSRFIPIEAGIERMRTFLYNPSTNRPRLFYNADTTRRSQAEYKRYRYPETKDGRPVREKPIDSDNHSIKAITYWLVNRYGFTPLVNIGQKSFRFGPPRADELSFSYPGFPQNRQGSLHRNRRYRRSNSTPFRVGRA